MQNPEAQTLCFSVPGVARAQLLEEPDAVILVYASPSPGNFLSQKNLTRTLKLHVVYTKLYEITYLLKTLKNIQLIGGKKSKLVSLTIALAW